jgi:hypothetical protein
MKPFFLLFSGYEVKFKALSVQLSFFEATNANAAVNYLLFFTKNGAK